MSDRVEASPGPWQEGDDISVDDANGVKVAVIYDGSERNKVGNRQLVTAGPELLDMVKRLARHVEAVTGCNPGSDSAELRDAAVALIARIEAKP